jgi:hypothetical protein
MPELRRIACPSCEAENVPLAVVEGIQEFRCRECGLVFYGPCGCDIVHEHALQPRVRRNELRGDWQMSRAPATGEGASAVKKFPGCS